MTDFYNSILEMTSRIERKWLKYQYSSDEFYKVAWEETENFDLSPLGEIGNQLDLLENPHVRHNQHRSTFSDFHFQIFHNGRFLIEVLNWQGSHVNVHDHDFSGVQFQLKGDSLNVVYDFKEDEKAGALRFGELSVRRAEMWREGSRSVVRAGDLDPHSVFHLGKPTTSLLIRTVATPRYGSQSNYFPTLAAHYYVSDDIQRKKLTALSLLSGQSPSEFRRCFTHFINTQSLSENFFMLLKLGTILFSETYVDLVYDYAGRGEREAKVVESVAYNNGIDFFKSRANLISEISAAEKLAASCVAASAGDKNFAKVLADLKKAEAQNDARQPLNSFVGKLDQSDQTLAGNYLNLFKISEPIHA